jgi:hypothetical protein
VIGKRVTAGERGTAGPQAADYFAVPARFIRRGAAPDQRSLNASLNARAERCRSAPSAIAGVGSSEPA